MVLITYLSGEKYGARLVDYGVIGRCSRGRASPDSSIEADVSLVVLAALSLPNSRKKTKHPLTTLKPPHNHNHEKKGGRGKKEREENDVGGSYTS